MQHTAPEWGGQWSVEFIAAARLRECFSAPLHCHLSSTLAGQYEYCSIQLPNIFWKVLKSGMSAKWDNTYENLGLISISWYNLHQCASCLARPFLSSALVWVIGGLQWRALFPAPQAPRGPHGRPIGSAGPLYHQPLTFLQPHYIHSPNISFDPHCSPDALTSPPEYPSSRSWCQGRSANIHIH